MGRDAGASRGWGAAQGCRTPRDRTTTAEPAVQAGTTHSRDAGRRLLPSPHWAENLRLLAPPPRSLGRSA